MNSSNPPGQVMRQKRLRVLALAKYAARAASTRQRLLQYQPFLSDNGVDVDVRPLLEDAYLDALMAGRQRSTSAVARAYGKRLCALLDVGGYDAVWVQYELFPYLPLIDGLFAAACPKPIISDMDDAIFHMYDLHRSATVRGLLGGKLRPLMRRSAISLCGNAYLRDYVERAGGRAIIVPTVLDSDIFCPAAHTVERPLTVGWIGSPSTWPYVQAVLPTLLPAIERLNGRFLVIGAGPAAHGIAGVESREWSEASEVADLQEMDIGLMPVPDEPWGRGKCGYKLIQYMACGVPTIASPVGVNCDIVGDGVDGFLAETEEEWVRALETLAADPALRRQMGVVGRSKIVRFYSLQSQRQIVLEAVRQVTVGAVAERGQS